MWHAEVRENESTGRTGGFGISGTIARPAPSVTEVPVDAETNGLEDFIEWERLETALANNKFSNRTQFKAEVRRQFVEAGVEFTRDLYESVVSGLFPESREIHQRLPIAGTKLDADVVREIRLRAAEGEGQVLLANEFGIRQSTVSDLINYKTWRNVA